MTTLLFLAAIADATAAALTIFVPDVLLGPAVMNGSARGTALTARCTMRSHFSRSG
ncbi:MAG TPA: hypothetical protein VHK05_10920 [Candidatus Limnocylindrales bacterium]|jgi:hypothetical protein|nr:hypothetical protein [Candidatus Limnocylindrales bacterium]